MSEIPSLVEQKLLRLAHIVNTSIEQLKEEYLNWYKQVCSDPSLSFLTTDEERHAYAIRTFWVARVAKPPTREVEFIPIGYVEERRVKSTGEPMSRVYGIYREPNGEWRKGILIGRGNEARIWVEVELFTQYTIRVSVGKGDMLWATPETKFENGRPLQLTVDQKIEFLKKIGIKVFQLKDVHKNISRTDESGFVDEWDLKGLYGIVIDYKAGKRSDGSNWAFYIVADDTVGESETDEDGNIIPRRFTVWVPSTMLKFDRNSELFFYGTVQKDSEGMPFMNAIGVIPKVPVRRG